MPSNASAPYNYEHDIICQLIEKGSKVLDLGCGEGELLLRLQQENGVQGVGVEVAEEKVYKCIGQGLSVHHGDIDEGLKDYPDKSFDYVILSETLQEVRKPYLAIEEMLRVGRRGIISFPNFGFWKARWQLFAYGTAPITDSLPFEWFDGPNIQFFSIKDFQRFCELKKIKIVQSVYFNGGHKVSLLPNLLAQSALCVLE